MTEQKRDHLPRLEPEAYRGQAYVHWTMTMVDRRSGWLIPVFNYKFRELLTHAAFRYAFACPIYCLMPDHFHMVWVGIDDRTDQLKASKYFRKQIGVPLAKLGFDLQHQPYDHVLREEERQEAEFENVVEYIARNPERKGLFRSMAFETTNIRAALFLDTLNWNFGKTTFGHGFGERIRSCEKTACFVPVMRNWRNHRLVTVATTATVW
jgi:putative transposase